MLDVMDRPVVFSRKCELVIVDSHLAILSSPSDLPVVVVTNNEGLGGPETFTPQTLCRICCVVGIANCLNQADLTLAVERWVHAGIACCVGFSKGDDDSETIQREMMDGFSVSHPDNLDDGGRYRYVRVFPRIFADVRDMMQDPVVQKFIGLSVGLHQLSELAA